MITKVYDKLIKDALITLKRQDLIEKVHTKERNFYYLFFPSQILRMMGYTSGICGAIINNNKIFKQVSPNVINMFGHSRHVNPKYRHHIVLHELCHIVDLSQDNDANIENGYHGESFWVLSDKLGLIRPHSKEIELDERLHQTNNFKIIKHIDEYQSFAQLLAS